ncbi:hypothetical protein HYW58_01140 [Candidatus Kaiserbacteria bacterium]|nr:hypothetical protein [Candidatus Kaiserbacteria bacterium]
MKKIIFISIIIIFLIPVTFFAIDIRGEATPLIAYAQEDVIETEEPAVSQTTGVQQTSVKNNLKTVDGRLRQDCGLTDVFCGVSNALNALFENIALLPIFISSFFVYIAGILLNLSIIETVLKFSLHFNAVKGINETWGVLRDLANIFFIFGLLAIAISTIIGVSSYGYKQLLARLLIIALVINFSLLFTKVIIDTSNIFALQFYKGIAATGSDGSTGIANTFTRYLGVTDIWESESVLQLLNKLNYSKEGGLGLVFLYSVFSSIFLMITAFVFFFAAIMLIIRGVGFILLAILSPLAFAALVLPKTQSMANLWWEKLWQYAIFAPVLLILFWVTANVIPSISASFIPQGAGLLQAFSPEPQARYASVAMILNFIVIITAILASVIIANRLSLAFGKEATRLAGKASFGALGFAGRHTFGRGFRRLAESEYLKEKASQGGFGGFAARQTLKAMRYGASANYDMRTPLGTPMKELGIDAGKPQKGGYAAIFEKQIKDRQKFAASLAPSQREIERRQGEAQTTYDAEQKRVETRKAVADKALPIAKTRVSDAQKKFDALKGQHEDRAPAEKRREIAAQALIVAQERYSNTQKKYEAFKKRYGEESSEAKSATKEMTSAQHLVDLAQTRIQTENKRLADIDEEVKKGRLSPEARKAKKELDSAQNLQALAEKRVKTEEKDLKDIGERRMDASKEIAGTAKRRTRAYADTLGSERVIETLFTKVPVKNKESAALIRKGKTPMQELQEKMQDAMKEQLTNDPEFKESLKSESEGEKK